ncbi:MAG: histidine kinase [Burkholderiaceae bacterium]
MSPAADTPTPATPGHPRAPYLARALRSAIFSALIGVGIALLRKQALLPTLAYALSIGMLCWFFIDIGRICLARALQHGSPARHPKTDGDWPGWPWMAAVVVVGSLLGLSLGTALGNRLTGEHSPGLLDAADPRDALALLLLALIPAIVITYFFYSRGVISQRQAAVQTAQRQAAEHRLRLLESQLEPHMLFNTLANLRVLIALDPPRAQVMLDQLIGFLRATLGASRASRHALRDEFARAADYLALIQVRMGERLATRIELPADLAELAVPPLLLQPLLENSIKHGLEPHVAGGRIELSAARERGLDGSEQLVLRVRDTGAGFSGAADGGTRFGLEQVRERLDTLYGTRASLELGAARDAEGGALATIRLPLDAVQPTPGLTTVTA